MIARREFFEHAGALGLGAVLMPFAGAVSRASDRPGAQVRPLPAGIVLETIESGGIAHYSYFLGDLVSGSAVVIDPRRDVEVYLELARQHNVTITHVLETHVHADFVSGARELAARTGAEIRASVEGGAEYGFEVHGVRDGDKVSAGGFVITAIHTPGHTPEHMAYLASSPGASGKPWALFTGDFLFAGSVGRPDLMGVRNTRNLAEQLYATLQSAFADLPDALPIYPAHGPGSPCGAGIVAREGIPTLGIERRSNPAFAFDDRDAFIADLLERQPPIPYYWPRMKQINARGPEVLGGLPEPQEMKPAEFQSLVADSRTQLLDTRHMLAFGGGHIPGAVNIGHSPSVSMWGGWLLDPERPIALVTPQTGTAADVVAWLVRIGITEFAGVLDGGMDGWVMAGKTFDPLSQMPVGELRSRMERGDLQVLDVRAPNEWDQGHLPGARYMFLPEIPERLSELDPRREIAVYCGTGYRASIAASLLRRGGFRVHNVPGSFGAWMAAGYDITVPSRPGKASDTRRA